MTLHDLLIEEYKRSFLKLFKAQLGHDLNGAEMARLEMKECKKRIEEALEEAKK